jgi:succinyl-CoA synthetase beta subunit
LEAFLNVINLRKVYFIIKESFKLSEIVVLKKTLVVRLSKTNSDKRKEILNDYAKKNSNFKILTVDNLDNAAKKAVSTLKKMNKLLQLYFKLKILKLKMLKNP